jgi:hypothetical protein
MYGMNKYASLRTELECLGRHYSINLKEKEQQEELRKDGNFNKLRRGTETNTVFDDKLRCAVLCRFGIIKECI